MDQRIPPRRDDEEEPWEEKDWYADEEARMIEYHRLVLAVNIHTEIEI